MKIVVLIAGVLDPKWPVAPSHGSLPEFVAERMILSPFDEAALEIGLKLKDADPATTISANVSGGPKLARAVAAFNIPAVATIALPTPWDQGAVSRALAQACGEADLILVGREFGDLDDGLVPPLLAALLGRPFFGRVQAVETGAPPRLLRENGSSEESLALSGPMLASVTNDRRTRLRKPLMKNVMMARQARIDTLRVASTEASALKLAGVEERAGVRAPVACTLLEGPPRAQAATLAELLMEARA